jgi:hypothetical protein
MRLRRIDQGLALRPTGFRVKPGMTGGGFEYRIYLASDMSALQALQAGVYRFR